MSRFARQTWALIEKTFLVAAIRRPISTALRALILPFAIVLIVAYAQYFFNPSQRFGVGHPTSVLPLPKAIPRASGGRNTVAFVDNGLLGGDISAVIEEVAEPFRKAGKSVVNLHNETDLLSICRSSQRGSSSCFAAAVFHSSPDQPASKGTWNYTIRADESLGGTIDVGSPNNDAQIYLLPLQNAIDRAIVAREPKGDPTVLETTQQYPYTVESEEKHKTDNRTSYLNSGIAYFAIVFFLAMTPIVYHLAGVMALEREQGLSQLVEAMMPNSSRWQPQVARLLSYYCAFSTIYFPSWLFIGVILARVVFVNTSSAIMIFYHLTVGLALCSYSILGASFYKKSQVCGITMIVIVICLAIVPQVLPEEKQTPTTVTTLSLLFPSSNYIYFIITVARWEVQNLPANLSISPSLSSWSLHGLVMWCFLIIQITVYPVLAALVERVLFDTSSKNRKVHPQHDVSEPTVRLQNFGKTYKPSWIRRAFGQKRRDVQAVNDLTLDARKGQILMLLGPNGSGKSTTLDAIAGLSRISSGTVDISGEGGIGFTPQRNVLWDDLTVAEHIKLLYSLKAARTPNTKADLTALIEGCDLVCKAQAKSKTLSGGQKRKLQLAMMFAGGSSVCCVDEATSGLDPLSRRKIWDILLAERGDRSIVMTTHFLDEADFLSDHIVILSKGELKAEGSSVKLKDSLGDGYSVHVPRGTTSVATPDIHGIMKIESLDQTIYNMPDSLHATRVLDALERHGVKDYGVSGPTLEELFLKLTETSLHVGSSQQGSNVATIQEKPEDPDPDSMPTVPVNLQHGRHIGPLKQSWILFRKRWTIIRRNYMPYVGALLIAFIGAGTSPRFLQYFEPMECAFPKSTSQEYSSYEFLESLATRYSPEFIGGPSDRISDDALAGLTEVYSANYTTYGRSAVTSVDAFRAVISPAEKLDEFTQKVAVNNATIDPGAFWLGDSSTSPRFAWQADSIDIANAILVQNILDNLLTSANISTSYSNFDISPEPPLYEFGALLFAIYFCLVFCLYPGFFAIYPTLERIRNVRALHYSNGVKPLPLWLAYLAFDSLLIVLISIVTIILLGSATPYWFHLPYIFLVLLLYGVSSAILSYIISMVARSHLAAWALCIGGQVFMCMAYFAAYLGVQSNTNVGDLESTLNKVHFTIAFISPIANVMRSIFVSLNQFLILCGHQSDPGSIEFYGGPILGFSFFKFIKCTKSVRAAHEYSEPASAEVLEEVTRASQAGLGLRVLHLSKMFGKNKAVDDLTFSVQRGEIFGLLGPNGAGKSTAISLIRGDIRPSNRNGDILVDEASVFTHRATARSRLGVCPQFDACDTLTVTEHLSFYARVRGVSDPSHNVEEVIRVFGLDPYRHRLAQKLSGGTKRKLSLAIALIGNPSVLLLDEPSSGLDAASKRVMWKTLFAISADRSTVLTTHSMEEADALATRAGIMSGRMLTLGTVDGLRRRWGNVYHVHLVTSSAPYTSLGEMERLKSWVRGSFEGAEIDEKTYCGQVRFSVPVDTVQAGGGSGHMGKSHISMGQMFRLLDGNKRALGVEYYSIGQTTMDEVFVRIVRQHGGKEENR
ncbi:MAG: hypothetical protein Q9167_001851 [Letrouitia subvulpina]